MLIFFRVILACVIGSAIGSLASCMRSRPQSPATSAPATEVASAATPTDFLASVTRDSSPDSSGEKPKGVPAPIEPIYRDDRPERAFYVTGVVRRGRRVNVQLSDGRILTEEDPELRGSADLHRQAVLLATGQRLFIMPAMPVPVSESTPAPLAPVVAQSLGVVQDNASSAEPPSSLQKGSDGVYRFSRSSSGIGH